METDTLARRPRWHLRAPSGEAVRCRGSGPIVLRKERLQMRGLKYHVATTVDGFIGHEDGSVDGFVAEGDHATEFLESLQNDYDVVLMGRKTYEFGLRLGVTDPYPWLEQYVFSRTMKKSPFPNDTPATE